TTLEREALEQGAQLTELRARSQPALEALRLLRSRSLELVELRGTEVEPGAAGRILWDRAGQAWWLLAADLAPLGPDRTYELWFITADQRKVPAGTFAVRPGGDATLHASLPADIGTIVAAAVTDEPAGGVPQPTGAIRLLGTIPSRAS
ncbi:MAG TPA: anti-sigma factor, partial [Candidatus Polarisedimenticolaceae bacterium]|nr:anti-sigma factor [Candidatus Polarisedimenticolaceae bacterium]